MPLPQFKAPTLEQLAHRFTHHPPIGDQAERYLRVRFNILECAKRIVDLTPVCPEQTRALNALDEAMFLANAAIARHEPRSVNPPAPSESPTQ